MGKNNLLYRYLSLNPFLKGNIEIGIIIVFGIISNIFKLFKMPFFPISSIIGGVFLVFSFLFHAYCEKYHKQAHNKTSKIEIVVTKGVYSKIRHPIYLSLMVMYVGTALIFNSWLSLFFGFIFSLSWMLTSIIEEEQLLKKFNGEYKEYMKNVRWRIIPGIF